MKKALALFLLLVAFLTIAATSAFYLEDEYGHKIPLGTSGTLHIPQISGYPDNVTVIFDHNDLEHTGFYNHSALDSHVDDASIHFPESSIDHTAIQNVGTNTHAQIDSHIADSSVHFTESSIDHTAIQNIGTHSHAQIDSHVDDASIHFTKASIDHDDLTGAAGYSNHSTIDAHIDDSSIHFTEASIDHQNISGAGTNTHAQIDSHIAETSIHAPIFDTISTATNTLWSSQYVKEYVDASGGSGFTLTVTDDTTAVSPVDTVRFNPAGFTVTNDGSGQVTINNLGGTGGVGDVLDTDTTCYVATTGSDTTGDGTSGSPYATPHKCLLVYAGYQINSDVYLTIQIADGTYILSDTLNMTHPYGDRIKILGEHLYTTTVSTIVSTSGSGGAYSITATVASAANIAVDDYVIVRNATGGTNPLYAEGVHKVTGVSGNDITFLSTHKFGTPSGSVSADVEILKTVLSFPDGVTGIYILGKDIGLINQLVITSPSTNNSAYHAGIRFMNNATGTLGPNFGVSGGWAGIAIQSGSQVMAEYVAVSGAYTFNILLNASSGGEMSYSISTGSTVGFATYDCSAIARYSTVTGNTTGMQANVLSSLTASGSNSTGNTTNYSPAVNVFSSQGGIVRY